MANTKTSIHAHGVGTCKDVNNTCRKKLHLQQERKPSLRHLKTQATHDKRFKAPPGMPDCKEGTTLPPEQASEAWLADLASMSRHQAHSSWPRLEGSGEMSGSRKTLATELRSAQARSTRHRAEEEGTTRKLGPASALTGSSAHYLGAKTKRGTRSADFGTCISDKSRTLVGAMVFCSTWSLSQS